MNNKDSKEVHVEVFKGFFVIFMKFINSRVYKGFITAQYNQASTMHFYRTRTIMAREATTSVASFYKRIELCFIWRIPRN